MRKMKLSFLVATIAVLTAATNLLAQDERGGTRETATVIENNQVNDDLDGSEAVYFYKFKGGPGKVTITFEVEAAETNAGATFEVYDTRSRPLLSNVLVQGVDKGSERVVKDIKLTKAQDVIIRVKGIRYGDSGGLGSYSITLGGAVVKTEKAPAENPAEKPVENKEPKPADKI